MKEAPTYSLQAGVIRYSSSFGKLHYTATLGPRALLACSSDGRELLLPFHHCHPLVILLRNDAYLISRLPLRPLRGSIIRQLPAYVANSCRSLLIPILDGIL